MTVSQLRKELQELKEEAANKPDLWMWGRSKELEESKVKEEIIKEIEKIKAKMQYYIDGGVFGDEDDRTINMNWGSDDIPTLTPNLIQRWKNRHNVTLKEKTQLYRDIGFFMQGSE